MPSNGKKGLYKPPYIYESQTISKFTDPREVLIDGHPRLPAKVIIALKKLEEARELDDAGEAAHWRGIAAGRMIKELEQLDALDREHVNHSTDDRNARATIARKRAVLKRELTGLLAPERGGHDPSSPSL